MPSLLTSLTRLMVLGSLLLAIAPQGCATLLPDRERSSLQEAVLLYNVLRKRRGWGADGELGTKGEQLLHLVQQADGVERMCHLGQFLLHLNRQDA